MTSLKWVFNDDQSMRVPRAEAESLLDTGHWRLGRGAFSPAHRARISASKIGQTVSSEQRRKISETMTGRTYSPERRAAISAGRMGMEFTDEHRHNISLAKANMSLEERAKHSEVLTGRRWVTSLRTDEGRQLHPEEAAERVASGGWRYGRPISHFH